MGVVEVVLNARTVLRNLSSCKKAVKEWKPDVLILVDYASFNLKIAKFVKKNMPGMPVHFYISPKIWAWKEYRIKAFRSYIDHLYVILPFETDFFSKHNYPVEYVGNPCLDSVEEYLSQPFDTEVFRQEYGLDERPILALLPGSRVGEIRRNLPTMLEVMDGFEGYQVVVAGAPGQATANYSSCAGRNVKVVFGQTYSLLRISRAAMVTSGTATLETSLIATPQVVCFAVTGGVLPNLIFKHLMHVDYFSLVNLIAGKPVVKELLGNQFTAENLRNAFEPLLRDSPDREAMLSGYAEVRTKLGSAGASSRAAQAILRNLSESKSEK